MEGPSIHILAEELQKLKNQKIKQIYGNAKFEKDVLINEEIQDVYTFGKRLILQLNDYAILIHFLMYGSYEIDHKKKEYVPRLAIITQKNALYIYNCSVKCIKEKNLKAYIKFEYDILSSTWDANKVIKKIKHYPLETIDDILLNQEIFAGVGNIIKNETLFLSKISPLKGVSELSEKQLKKIAEQTRKFSQRFLELRKNFELNKNLQIYRKSKCPVCQTKVIRKITGKRRRWSFFCPQCQK